LVRKFHSKEGGLVTHHQGLVLEISARASGWSTCLGSTGCIQARLAGEPVILPEKGLLCSKI